MSLLIGLLTLTLDSTAAGKWPHDQWANDCTPIVVTGAQPVVQSARNAVHGGVAATGLQGMTDATLLCSVL